jgi:hypothetical protein
MRQQDVIKTADHVIDLGPGGGVNGGEIVVTGTPEDVAACDASFTGQYLKPLLGRASPSPLAGEGRLSEAERGEGASTKTARSPATAGTQLSKKTPAKADGIRPQPTRPDRGEVAQTTTVKAPSEPSRPQATQLPPKTLLR